MFRDLRAPTPLKVHSFVIKAKRLKLAFDLTLSLQPVDRVHPPLNETLLSHMNTFGLSFSSSASSSQASSPSTPSSSYTPPLWAFLISEKSARVAHKGALMKLDKNTPSSLTLRQLEKITERWPKVPSHQDQEPERKLIFVGVSDLLNHLSASRLITIVSANNRGSDRSISSTKQESWVTCMLGASFMGSAIYSKY
jgi:heme/copper-type cytochrome/quinol oxidase subunit 3